MCVCGAPACVCVRVCVCAEDGVKCLFSVLISFSRCGSACYEQYSVTILQCYHDNILFTHCTEAADTLLPQDIAAVISCTGQGAGYSITS